MTMEKSAKKYAARKEFLFYLLSRFLGRFGCVEHRRTGNFLPGKGGGGAVDHLPKKLSQVPQIFTKESKRNEDHIATT